TFDTVAQLAALDHVVRAVPELEEAGEVQFAGQQHAVSVVGVPAGVPQWEPRVGARRRPPPGARQGPVAAGPPCQGGVRPDAAVEGVLGRKLRLTVHNPDRTPYYLLGLIGVQTGKLSPGEALLLAGLADRLPAVIERLAMTPAERELLDRLKKDRDPGRAPA